MYGLFLNSVRVCKAGVSQVEDAICACLSALVSAGSLVSSTRRGGSSRRPKLIFPAWLFVSEE